MPISRNTVKRLASMTADKNQEYLSVYIPAKDRSKDKIKKKVKSLLLSNAKVNGNKDSINLVIDFAEMEIDKNNLSDSIALFAVIDKKNNGSMEFFSIPDTVDEKVVFADVFDLVQLASALPATKPGLLISINENKASAWKINGDKPKLIAEVVNTDLKDWELESNYLDKYSPNKNDQAVYSTGKDKIAKLKKEVSRKFLEEFLQILKEERYENIAVYFSSKLKELVKDFNNDLNNFHKAKVFVAKNKQLNNVHDMAKEAKADFKKNSHSQEANSLKNAKNSVKPFVNGWKEVAEAASAMRIDKLYLKRDSKKEGFISETGIFSTYPVKNSRKTNNLAAWITRSAINTNSDIILIDKGEPSATLRY